MKRLFWLEVMLLVMISMLVTSMSYGSTGKGISFTWQANQEENLLGYRLYYGGQSRASGSKYDYFFDFGSWEVCSTDINRPACEAIREEVSCSSLDGEEPRCRVIGLSAGKKYFALTAYSEELESRYSQELQVELDGNGNVAPQKRVALALTSVYQLLLNKR